MSQLYLPLSKNNPDTQGYFLGRVPLSDKSILVAENLVIQTGFLKSRVKPISFLLIGKPGTGKSRLLSVLAHLPFVSYVNDITPKYLVEFLEQVKNGKRKFLVIPDFTSCTSHGKSTQKTLIAILRSMTEEGVTNLSDYHLEFKSDFPARAGLLTAITSSSYSEFAQSWKKTGFLSRLLPFSFSHSFETKNRILDAIDNKNPDSINAIKLHIEKRPQKITCDSKLLFQLRAYSELLSKETSSEPYRHQIQLDALAEASAILRGSSRVTQKDVNTIHWLSNWINYDFKEL